MKMLPTLHLHLPYSPTLRKCIIMLWHHFLGPASLLTSGHCRLFPKCILLVSACSFLLDDFRGSLEGLFTFIWVKTQGPEDLWAVSSFPASFQTHSAWHITYPGEKKSSRHYQLLERVYKSLFFHLKTQVEHSKFLKLFQLEEEECTHLSFDSSVLQYLCRWEEGRTWCFLPPGYEPF